MNEKELTGVVDAVIRKMADVSDMTLDMALALSEAVRKKASEIGVKAVVAVSNVISETSAIFRTTALTTSANSFSFMA